ncbi:choice-of-anchor Q domain-containing protein [Tunicatimonas pelagia]|uniref:choice-of-anchor Q domain-containing protein n=1 Tax=Tunicatimonas pelagia TaxID=931531 RepID=UPI0026654E7B|nr:choice-of-anchor Q domain-containing protein [Tunicatimonas pelagia]WKN41620.1 choice-of-anchor Q domain-containing protein [Tunicatimonas pelagia]
MLKNYRKDSTMRGGKLEGTGKKILLGGVVSCLLWFSACTPEEEIFTEEAVQLQFDRDTVQFDTLFTTRGSTSQLLTVYNSNRNAVTIASVATGRGNASPYTVTLNGNPGQQFENIRLLGGDSLLLLVEVFIDPQDENLPFLEKDSLVFRVNGNQQDVKLIAWGQDAHFHQGWIISQDTTLRGDRPFVIQDSLWIEPDVTVKVDSGARFFFDNGAFALVQGTLKTEGTVTAPVIFRNVRTDGNFGNAFGQWDGITFTTTSRNNVLRHTYVRSAINGVVINTPDADTIPDLILANVIIENMAGYGLLAIGSDVDVYNTQINRCVLGLAYNVGNGYYRYRHCTLDNSGIRFAREDEWYGLAFSELLPEQLDDLQVSNQPFYAELTNSILWGILDDELIRNIVSENSIISLNANLLKYADATLAGNIFNENPLFADPVIAHYQLDTLSPAINQGIPTSILTDLKGARRDDQPDLGAYEYQIP